MRPRLSISMLCLNRLDLTKRCIESIARWTEDYELLVWDNGSTDGTREYLASLRASWPWTRGILEATRREKNEGFIVPHNVQARGARGVYVCILNNDVEVGEGWADKLITPFNRGPWLGATGPRDEYGFLNGSGVGIAGPKDKEPEYLSGHCLMVPSWIIRLHGLFDEQYTWATCEDSDFSLRLRQAGYRILTVDAPVTHTKRATLDRISPAVLGYDPQANERHNTELLQRRWFGYLRNRSFNRLRILVRRNTAMGDVLCVEPILRGLRAKYPSAHITFVGSYAHVLAGCPVIDRLTRDSHVLSEKYDLTIDLVGEYERQPNVHLVEAYARKAGVPVDRPRWYLDEEGQRMAVQLPDDRPIAISASEGSWSMREWPKERFREVGAWLAKHFRLIEVGEKPSAYTGVGWDLCGKTTLQQLAGLYSKASLAVMCDSLHVHMAACFKVPSVGIWGGTNPWLRIHGPEHIPVRLEGFHCLACHHDRQAPRERSECDGGAFRGLRVATNACMNVTTHQVLAAIGKLMEAGNDRTAVHSGVL